MLSLPLMLSGLIGSVLHMANVVIVPRRLFQCGYSMEQATRAMGELFGMAQPIVFFPQVLVFPAASAGETPTKKPICLISCAKRITGQLPWE
jgi:hypothetical protein